MNADLIHPGTLCIECDEWPAEYVCDPETGTAKLALFHIGAWAGARDAALLMIGAERLALHERTAYDQWEAGERDRAMFRTRD